MFEEYYPRLHLSKHYKNCRELFAQPPLYDIYLTGSDQTLNPNYTKGDPVFTLDFAPAGAKRVAFSASMCRGELPKHYLKAYESLANYSAITLRESASAAQVEALSGIRPQQTLDPTLLLSGAEWLQAFPADRYKGEAYILLYMLDYAFQPQPYIYELLQALQQQTGLKIYSITPIAAEYIAHYGLCLEMLDRVTIDDFISLHAHASYMVTSSFHGTAFAANFATPLYAVVPHSEQENRQVDFLRSIELEGSIFPIGRPFELISEVADPQKIAIQRTHSLALLREMLT